MARKKAAETAEQKAARLSKQRAYSRAWVERDPVHAKELDRARSRRAYAKDPERAAQRMKASRAEHGQKWNEERRRRYAEDPDRRAAISFANRIFYERNAEKMKEEARRRYRADPESHQARARSYRLRKSDVLKEKVRQYRIANRDALRGAIARWRSENSDYVRLRYKTDPAFRVACLVRSRFALALKRRSARKLTSVIALTGCTLAELQAHIERQFSEGMDWNNHGAWHIDHIRPCNAFDLTDPTQQAECFHFSNLRPLWAAANLARARGPRCPKHSAGRPHQPPGVS